MSTNSTAAIAGPQGSGKGGSGVGGVSDSASVARRCVSSVARAAQRVIRPTPFAFRDISCISIANSSHLRFPRTSPQAAKRADVSDGACPALYAYLASRSCDRTARGVPDAACRPQNRVEPPSVRFDTPGRVIDPSFVPPFRLPSTDERGRRHLRLPRRGQHLQLDRDD